MTPPDTDLRKQARRHRPALYAIAFVVFFAFLTLLVRAFVATDPEATARDVQPTLGAEEGGTSPPNPAREPDED